MIDVTEPRNKTMHIERTETILNGTTKMLQLTNVPAMRANIDCDLGSVGLDQLTVHIGELCFACQLSCVQQINFVNRVTLIDIRLLLSIHCIGTKPEEVKLQCFSYDWDGMNCFFEQPTNYVYVEYRMSYKMDTQPKFFHPIPNQCNLERKLGFVFCNISGTAASWRPVYEYFFVEIVATNSLGTTVQNFTFNTRDLGKQHCWTICANIVHIIHLFYE